MSYKSKFTGEQLDLGVEKSLNKTAFLHCFTLSNKESTKIYRIYMVLDTNATQGFNALTNIPDTQEYFVWANSWEYNDSNKIVSNVDMVLSLIEESSDFEMDLNIKIDNEYVTVNDTNFTLVSETIV